MEVTYRANQLMTGGEICEASHTIVGEEEMHQCLEGLKQWLNHQQRFCLAQTKSTVFVSGINTLLE